MGLFTRKRPPVYKWNDDWEPHFIPASFPANNQDFQWTCDHDHYYHLVSLTFNFQPLGSIHTVNYWFELYDGSDLIIATGPISMRNLANYHVCVANFGDRFPNSSGFHIGAELLPDHFYITPGQTLKALHYNTLTTDQLRWVNLYLKRWSLR